ncbi:RHS repeat domain-containing protein [Pseudomonas fragariae (ex Marin et al. 2024)]|uniref:RHS repeat protein n=2 Tax=Pseudomonas fragariae (ex Marin et al. 2024) TaxID=3080056 RepID=A0ABT3LJY9_9PSED|nr:MULTISPECIES: RHS repeat-associated core domain-containing protein [unclassified Pseudomonas]MCW6056776.1 RHS repeat protein [Pseudomonas fragi]MDV0426857.1 RHS repeat-associated core domain-containing protein [Pseudomonas sp. 17]MDX9573008.1 RHS repeat-associated core domain-containing protein [Pseudomonas sp. 21(2023)]MDX9586944.1 RHS repeat-associated core domain-containing protein [Pseudomonas sp. 19(2023)]MDX9624593.1 RHS repeat-associated core domain-containing protein [Pseudomonas sp
MNAQSAALHHHTPRLTVIDPRGLEIRAIDFRRNPLIDTPERLVNRAAHDAAGHPVSCWDARLWESQAAVNLATVFSLSGQALLSDSVDAGWRLMLAGDSGAVVAGWDGRGTERSVQYDALLRPVAIIENGRCVERRQYGGPDTKGHNQCGQCIRHDDPAGSRMDDEFALAGGVLEQTRHFLFNPENVDWPEPLTERDALLESGPGATTRWARSPPGDVISQTDAQRNVQTFAHSVAGHIEAISLSLPGQTERILIHRIDYDAQGHVTSETAGNGVMTKALHDAANGRLIELKGTRADGQLLQHLLYDYDPVGNVLRIEDRAQPTRYYRNQRLEPVSTYQYDTLYQLIQATGTESAKRNQGPVFPSFQVPPDPTQLANYRQTYRYDASGNLLQLTHTGTQSHSRTLVTSQTSNRSLPVINDQPPDEAAIAAAFDANGNLSELQAGQAMSWDWRNQLQQVRPVVREAGDDDKERYVYDASGQRLRKIHTTKAKAVVHNAEVRYLPGLEVHSNSATAETLHVIVTQAGRNEVRVLHWQAGQPEGLENDQVRYSFADHLGSGTLELDKNAHIISQESYYPFGGTSWWAGRSTIEASYKTIRYSGKERDATGLYYYGLRYYAPWLQRWINPDPAGTVDGMNLYRFVRNSPLRFADQQGAAPYDVPITVVVAKDLSEFSPEQLSKMYDAKDAAVSLLGFTRSELLKASPRRDVNKAFDATFGALAPSARAATSIDVEDSLRQMHELIEGIGSPESDLTLFLFDGPEHILASTHFQGEFDESVERIGVSASLLANYDVLEVARSLIHEASHVRLNTMDAFYYLTDPDKLLVDGADTAQVKAWSGELRKSLRKISKHGPNEKRFDPANYIVAMQALTENAHTPAQRKQEFLSTTTTRTSLLLMNADTLSSLVMATGQSARYAQTRINQSGH